MTDSASWGLSLEAAICERCDWRYLLPQGSLPLKCPNCFQVTLTALTEQAGRLPDDRPPKLILPFTLTTNALAQSLQNFAGGIWFAPKDLNLKNLTGRIQRIYLPMWLVDSEAQARWQAEAGFNYEVVSYQDRFDQNRGGWVSQRVTETRIRWEPRLGRLSRTYNNVTAPALEEHRRLQQKLGPYNLEAARPYRAEALAGIPVRLPNRPPADAWPEVVPAIRSLAAEECRRACRADHWREFRWQADYADQNWTLLLLPLYVTYYLDDAQQPQPILINGQTGHLSGPRRASLKRAQQTALMIMGVGGLIFVLSLAAALASLLLPPLRPAAAFGLLIALLTGLLALAPLVIAWQANRTVGKNSEW